MDLALQQYRRKLSQGEGSLEEFLSLLSRSGFQIGEGLSEQHREITRMHLLHPGSADFSNFGTSRDSPVVEAIRVSVEAGLAKRCLLVTPSTMSDQWVRLFQKNAPNLELALLNGKASRKKSLLESSAQVFIISYESAINLEDALLAKPWDITVVNESHRIGVPWSRRSQLLYKIADISRCRIALTCCLAVNRDPWGVFRFVDSSIFGTSYREFLSQYFSDENRLQSWKKCFNILKQHPGIHWPNRSADHSPDHLLNYPSTSHHE